MVALDSKVNQVFTDINHNMTDIAASEPEMKSLLTRMKNIFHSAVMNCRGGL